MLRIVSRNVFHKVNIARGVPILRRPPGFLLAAQHVQHFSSEGPSNPQQQNSSLPEAPHQPKEKKQSIVQTVKGAMVSVADFFMNPRESWKMIKEVIDHYWVGSKLLWSEIKIAKDILKSVVSGHDMTRRERLQLIRTTRDIFRLVPFSIFVIVPFMELLLPLALKLFPDMLPSTFQVLTDSLLSICFLSSLSVADLCAYRLPLTWCLQ
jgi:hypothetical protein